MGSDPLPFFGNLFLAHKKDHLLRLRRLVNLEQLMYKKSVIPLGLSMTCYHYIKTVPLTKITRIFIQKN